MADLAAEICENRVDLSLLATACATSDKIGCALPCKATHVHMDKAQS